MSEYQSVTIGDVCDVGDGAHSKVERVSKGIPYLTSKNIKQGALDTGTSNNQQIAEVL
jgi:type I restriction enzyme S subunit